MQTNHTHEADAERMRLEREEYRAELFGPFYGLRYAVGALALVAAVLVFVSLLLGLHTY